MDTSLNIILSLEGEDSVSTLKTQVFEEELKEINEKFPLGENQIDIKQTYLLKKDNIIEAGIFIRNGLKNKISIKTMPIVLQDNKGNILASESLNSKKFGIIPPYSARPYTVNFKIEDGFNFDNSEVFSVKFEDVNNINALPSVAAEIENMPIDISFEEEQDIKNFAHELPILKTDEFTISLYKLNYNEKDGLDSILLLRNGTSKSVNLDKLPISIVDETGLIIARKVFEDKEAPFTINPKKSKLIKLEFNSFEISREKSDLSKCNIVYK